MVKITLNESDAYSNLLSDILHLYTHTLRKNPASNSEVLRQCGACTYLWEKHSKLIERSSESDK